MCMGNTVGDETKDKLEGIEEIDVCGVCRAPLLKRAEGQFWQLSSGGIVPQSNEAVNGRTVECNKLPANLYLVVRLNCGSS